MVEILFEPNRLKLKQQAVLDVSLNELGKVSLVLIFFFRRVSCKKHFLYLEQWCKLGYPDLQGPEP